MMQGQGPTTPSSKEHSMGTPARAEGQVAKLPVHGFVLAGGKSSRMGTDKALLQFRGRLLVEIAVEKLREFCTEVSIAGNREDLSGFAPVVREERVDCGPAAGIEAGLKASTQEWAMFVPVDAPLVPGELLRIWVEEALRVRMSVSYLGVMGKQPAFCLLQRELQAAFSGLLDEPDRRLNLEQLLNYTADADGYASWMYDERDLYGYPDYRGPDVTTLERWFWNVNTPQDLKAVEAWAKNSG
jgi:molybdopterin-guanine dinucleotide biosynthesis protein A